MIQSTFSPGYWRAACGELKVDSYRYFKDVYRDEIL